MADVIDRRYLLIKKLVALKKKHGDDKGVNLFKDQYGQKGVDDVFNYIVSCSTPQNHNPETDSFRLTPTV